MDFSLLLTLEKMSKGKIGAEYFKRILVSFGPMLQKSHTDSDTDPPVAIHDSSSIQFVSVRLVGLEFTVVKGQLATW